MTSGTGKKSALTFIELVIVTLLIGVLSAVAVPRLKRTFNSLQLSSAAHDMQAFMNYVRNRAIAESRVMQVSIDAEKKSYWASAPDGKGATRVYVLPRELDIETAAAQALFYPDGSIDAFSLTLTNPYREQVTLTTKGVYGKVRLQEGS